MREYKVSHSRTRHGFLVSELEQELVNGMAKLKILGVDVVSEKIEATKERIRRYEEHDKDEEAEKASLILTQLQSMVLLDEENPTLKSDPSIQDDRSDIMENAPLAHELANIFERLKILDVTMFAEKIQAIEERIKSDEGDTEELSLVLKQLKALELIDQNITKFKSDLSNEGGVSEG